MIEGMEYDTQVIELGPFTRLLLYSDGVYEIAKPDGAMWKVQEFVDFVSALPREAPVADRLLEHVRQMHGSDVLADDFSVLEVWF
jgi:sigma-B regulation protein RsbU (phosphoserine phosphatase)